MVEWYSFGIPYPILHPASHEMDYGETVQRGEPCRDLGERWLGVELLRAV